MKRRVVYIILVAVCLLTIQVVQAAEADYGLSWWTVDAGGGSSTGGNFVLTGTVGQAEPGLMNGGNYSITGGFWAQLQALLNQILLPIVLKP